MFIKLKLPINLATIYVEIPTTKNKKFNNGVRVHERTHASDAYPQYKAIEDILKKIKVMLLGYVLTT